MWYVLGAVLVVTASVGAVRIYKDQQLKKNDPVAYAKLKAARKKARARRREERKKVKEAVEKISEIPTATINAGVKATNEINNTITPFLYGQSQENRNNRSR